MMALPVLPPAPTKPQMRPSERLLTKGTTENSAPHAPCGRRSITALLADSERGGLHGHPVATTAWETLSEGQLTGPMTRAQHPAAEQGSANFYHTSSSRPCVP